MSEMRSAIDGLLVVDDAALSDDQLVADLDDVEHATRQLEVVRARRLAELERRQVWSRDGHLSVVSWLASRHRLSHTVAASHTRTARALEQMPVMAQAFAAGDVSSSAVTLLAHARETAPEQFARAEQTLVEAARILPIDQLHAGLIRWREHANAERAAEDDEARHERRAVSTAVTFEGMVESTVTRSLRRPGLPHGDPGGRGRRGAVPDRTGSKDARPTTGRRTGSGVPALP
jgi:hypothetical protein